MEYQRDEHRVHLVVFHLVWTPKRRKPVLVGKVASRCRVLIQEKCKAQGWEIVELAIQPDHVHLFVRVWPKDSAADVLKEVKGITAHHLRLEFPALLKMPSLWTRSYFCSTAGNVSSETIQRYIAAQTVVIGDVRNIRQNNDKGSTANQKIHQWSHGKIRFYTTYKSEIVGMEVKLQEESYTSQECPVCAARRKMKGRVFECLSCGLIGHRDVVGSWNIRKKYLKKTGQSDSSVVGFMAQPTGIRFHPHLSVAQERSNAS